MKVSKEGIEFIIAREGFEIRPYKDTKGLWTVGVGHLLTDAELRTGVVNLPEFGLVNKNWRKFDKADIENLLEFDLKRFEETVNSIDVRLAQFQFDALVSFAFNIGIRAFLKSTLVAHLRNGTQDIENQFMRWVIPPEIKGRREKEVRLYKYGKYT